MIRNTKTTVEKLSVGDRFYKFTDKHKTVLEMVEYPGSKTAFKSTKLYFIPASVTDHVNYAQLSDDRKKNFTKTINQYTEVIFLRSKAE